VFVEPVKNVTPRPLWELEKARLVRGLRELIDWEEVGVGMLNRAGLWQFGGIDLADLRGGRYGE
jgi:hypothetical protein